MTEIEEFMGTELCRLLREAIEAAGAEDWPRVYRIGKQLQVLAVTEQLLRCPDIGKVIYTQYDRLIPVALHN